ncbi:E3 ubiquitin-protein ligase RGLG [Marchantia polymorpha subsp. ruderalis]|uniref:RING-type domain-containing protein n=2 Tax=Marchantia polymorpha TaxID=3197 RepID=A0AAF6BSQ3_MARPO|nr:hypothetical protein MARPO_0170s0034 [Marchantia polymorpha]BBN15037.1 hypothetical protein Mp_6g16430 [Marchantia polymorpha subsp. ruderalis]|eukprot:PTQ28230.1 hypothetical protein MARPO_0170s0034 [Marchantia polymorpha]
MGGGQSRVKPPAPEFDTSRPVPSASRLNRRFSRKFSYISDQYQSLEQVTESLSNAGLESSNLILGIDFTKSNEWTGKQCYNGRSLHAIGEHYNPYESAISIIGRTLSQFDEDNLIPCFGFGDVSTHDHFVFSFYEDQRPCHGFEEALHRYRQLVPCLRLAGPTSFAPIIDAAVGIVEESGGQYHVLVIVADGQVTRSVETGPGKLSAQEKATIDAIVAASDHPLSIILVGVGDGPWDMMREFDDNIPARAFDNFQFVNFTDIMSRGLPMEQREAKFALSALMEIPQQFKATQELKLLGRRMGRTQHNPPLPPPQAVLHADSQLRSGYAQPGGYTQSGSFAYNPGVSRAVPPYASVDTYPPKNTSPPDYMNLPPHQYPPRASAYTYPPQQSRVPEVPKEQNEEQTRCQVCYSNKRDMAFGCGHQTCQECGRTLQDCPFCRKKIATRIRLFI